MKKLSGFLAGTFIIILGIFISKYTGVRLGNIVILLLTPFFVYLAYLFFRIKYVHPISMRKNRENLEIALNNHRDILLKHGLQDQLPEHDKMAKDLLSQKNSGNGHEKNL